MQDAAWIGKGVELCVDQVAKAYGARRVLRDFSLTAHGGEVVAITGANGSGKSTLLRIVAGLLRPARGTITLRVGTESFAEVGDRRRRVGYASPDLALYPELTGRENLHFFAVMRGRDGAEACDADLRAVGLADRGGDRVSAYSSGMRQRLRLAFARGANAPILLLDEPSLALDSEGVTLVGEMVVEQRARGGVTLLATNDARESALGDRVVALSR